MSIRSHPGKRRRADTTTDTTTGGTCISEDTKYDPVVRGPPMRFRHPLTKFVAQRDSFGCGPVAVHNILVCLRLLSPGVRRLYMLPNMCGGGLTLNGEIGRTVSVIYPKVTRCVVSSIDDVRHHFYKVPRGERRCALINWNDGNSGGSNEDGEVGHFIVVEPNPFLPVAKRFLRNQKIKVIGHNVHLKNHRYSEIFWTNLSPHSKYKHKPHYIELYSYVEEES